MGTSVNQVAASFASNWGAAAQQAGAQLDVSPALLLAQWGLESGYGTSAAAQAGNLAGIQTGGVNRTYPDAASFVSDYVATIKSFFPAAVGTKDNADAFVTALSAGTNGSYFGTQTPASYETGVLGVASTLANNTPSTAGLGSVFGSGANGFQGSSLGTWSGTPSTALVSPVNGTGTASPAACTGLSSVFVWSCWSAIAADVALVFLGLAMIVVGVTAGVHGDATVLVMPSTYRR